MPKKKKPKAVMVDGIPIEPISPAEHRRLEGRIKKKYEKLRRRYPMAKGRSGTQCVPTNRKKPLPLPINFRRRARVCASGCSKPPKHWASDLCTG